MPASITSIGSGSLQGCSGLRTATIPASVTSIGASALQGCTGLTAFTIPALTTSVGSSAFKECTQLTSITIPSLITSISDSLLLNCTSLTSVIINGNVTSIGSASLQGCTGLKDFTIPESTTSIGGGSFQGCSGITSISIPAAVTNIGSIAFKTCSKLTSVYFYAVSTIPTIGASAFYGINSPAFAFYISSVNNPDALNGIGFNTTSSLWSQIIGGISYSVSTSAPWTAEVNSGNQQNTSSSITIPATVINKSTTYNVISIGDDAFKSCTGLTNITIPSSVTTIGNNAFNGCSGLTNINIPSATTSVGSSAFNGCTGFTSINIPASIINVGSNAFNGCSGLTSVYFLTTSSIPTIGANAFQGTNRFSIAYYISTAANSSNLNGIGFSSVSYVWAATINTISYTLSTGSQNTATVDIGNKSNASSAIIIPSSITVATLAFSVTTIGTDAFATNGALTSISLPNTIAIISPEAFNGCANLTSISIPSSVTSIASDSFKNCTSLTGFSVSASNANYSNDSAGALFNKVATALLQYPLGNPQTSYTIPSSVTSVGASAFLGCTTLQSVLTATTNLGFSFEGVQEFGALRALGRVSAFAGLSSVTLPNTITNIEAEAFQGCTSLTSVTIPNSVTSIGAGAFTGCTTLTSLVIPSSVTSIGAGAFQGCTSLTTITLPSTTKTISATAFQGSTSLSTINIPGAVTLIETGAFQTCTSLTSFTVDQANQNYSVDSFGVLFDNSKKTLIQFPLGISNTSYTIPSSVTTIATGAFSGSTGLIGINIPNSVITIGDSAFKGCTGLPNVTIPISVTSIGATAFKDCSSLKTVYFLNSSTIPTLGTDAFAEISGGAIAYYNASVQNALQLNNVGFSVISRIDAQVVTTNQTRNSFVCFKEDSMILTINGYVKIQDLRKGDLIKTLKHDYVPINMIGKREIQHIRSEERIKDQLYKCSQEFFPEVFEDLVITGCHCILMDEFVDDEQIEKTREVNGNIYITEDKYRIPACVDERTTVYETAGSYTIYHLALDNDDYYMNYGVYANGLLVETCSQRYLKELSNMTLIE